MTRFYGLVLIPGSPPVDEACAAAADLLFPYQQAEAEPERAFKFDWFLQPDDLAEEEVVDDIEEDPMAALIWRASETIEAFPSLEVEAIVTPDGQWHEVHDGQAWDDDEWVARARGLLREHGDALALKHVFHI